VAETAFDAFSQGLTSAIERLANALWMPANLLADFAQAEPTGIAQLEDLFREGFERFQALAK
jgi:hypothetical protein